MIEIKSHNQRFTVLDSGWTIGTFETVREVREILRQLINFRFQDGDNMGRIRWSARN